MSISRLTSLLQQYEANLQGGSQDRELVRVSPGLIGLQDLFDELLDLPLGHPVAVAGLPEDVDALRQLVVDAGLTPRCAHCVPSTASYQSYF